MHKTPATRPEYWWRTQRDGNAAAACAVDLKPGSQCPACRESTLQYDSLFLLTCPRCGYVAESGAFT